MRLLLTAVLISFFLALAGCGKDSKGDKDKKNDPPAGGTGTPATGPGSTPVAPAAVAGMGSPPQQAAQKFVIDVRKPEPIDLNRVTARFLKVIGKPLSPLAEDQAKQYNATEVQNWLRRAGEVMGADAQLSPTTGYTRDGAAVFVGSYASATAPKGRYLIRLVDEGGAWKLDWFQVSAVEAKDPAAAIDPFLDFAVLAAADLVSGGPMKTEDRAPLAAAILSTKIRTSLDVNQPADSFGYDYKRGILATRLDAFLGGKVESYLRSAAGSDGFKVEFTLAGGAKKTAEIKLVKGDGPGNWVIDEIKQ